MKKTIFTYVLIILGLINFGKANSKSVSASNVAIYAAAITGEFSSEKVKLDTLGITNGSIHMVGTFKYLDFLKKHKGKPTFKLHIWYNPSGSSLSKREIKAVKDEIYFIYGRNLKTSSIEMDFKFGQNAKQAFAKKKYKELIKLSDLINFDIFGEENFSGSMAYEALEKALD
jgi:hypothetical protein